MRNAYFSGDEVTAIVRRALEGQRDKDAVSYDELSEVAAQFGLSRSDLDAAIEAELRQGQIEAARDQWRARKKSKFHEHLISFLIVNGALSVMNMMTSDYPWVLWVVVSWGIGLAFDAAESYFPDEEKVEKGAHKILAADERRRKRERVAAVS